MSQSIDINFERALARIWRARRTVFLYQLLVMIAAIGVLLWWPRTYQSISKLYLQRGRESVGLDPTANVTGNSISLNQAGREGEIKTAMDVLASRGLIEPVVDELGPDVILGKTSVGGTPSKSDPVSDAIFNFIGAVVEQVRKLDPTSQRERAIIEVEKNLVVDSERKSEIVSIVYESDSPHLSQLVVDTLINKYQAKHLELHRTPGSTTFFKDQSDRLRKQVEASAQELQKARDAMGIASIDGHRQILESQLAEIRSDALVCRKMLYGSNARMENLANQIRQTPNRLASAEVSKPNEGADKQRQLLYGLQIEQMGAAAILTPDHPRARKLRKQVQAAEKILATQQETRKEQTEEVNPVVAHLKLAAADTASTIATYTARQAELRRQEQEVLDQIADLNRAEVEIAQLKRDVNVADKKYQRYAENVEEARIDQAMQESRISSLNVVQAATFQEKPVAPSKLLTAVVAVMMAVAGSVVIAYIAVRYDDTISTSDDVREYLDIPVWCVIPESRNYGKVLLR